MRSALRRVLAFATLVTIPSAAVAQVNFSGEWELVDSSGEVDPAWNEPPRESWLHRADESNHHDRAGSKQEPESRGTRLHA